MEASTTEKSASALFFFNVGFMKFSFLHFLTQGYFLQRLMRRS